MNVRFCAPLFYLAEEDAAPLSRLTLTMDGRRRLKRDGEVREGEGRRRIRRQKIGDEGGGEKEYSAEERELKDR